MKNISKILSVILTLALLAGSLVMALPVAAADEFAAAATDKWLDDADIPKVVMGSEANVFTIAANGTTMFLWSPLATAIAKTAVAGTDKTLYVNNTDGFPATGFITFGGVSQEYTAKSPTSFTLKNAAGANAVKDIVTSPAQGGLFRSGDAGLTWSGSNLTAPAVNSDTNPIKILEVCPTDVNELIATDGTSLFRSTDGGEEWFATTDPGVGAIRGIDIADSPNGIAIIAGGATGVAQLNPSAGGWTLITALVNLMTATNVYALAFSPDYANDSQVLAVTNNGADTYLETYFKNKGWNKSVCIAKLNAGNTSPATSTGALIDACIAFPSYYSYGSSNNQVFVGISAVAALNSDVYRVTGKLYNPDTPAAMATCKDTGAIETGGINSIAVSGAKSSVTVIVATDDPMIIISTNATGSNPEWNESGKYPYASNGTTGIKLALASTGILYAGTSGAHSGFYNATADFQSFNGISRMEVANVYKVDFSRGVLKDPNGQGNKFSYYYWKNTTTKSWEMRKVAGGGTPGFNTVPSGARGAPTMYAVLNATPNQIEKTTDGGLTWATLNSPGGKDIQTLTVVNDTTYWIGYTGYIRSNTGSAIATGDVVQTISSIDMVGKTGILVGCNGRTPATWVYSADSGATWKTLGTQDKFAGALASKYVVSQNTIYEVDKNGALWTCNLGAASPAWEQRDDMGLTDKLSIKTINAISDVIYVGIAKAGVDQIYRSLPGRFDFRPMPGTKAADIGGKLDGLSVYDNADGSFNVKPTLVDMEVYGFTLPTDCGISIGKLYADTTFGPLKAVSPAEGSQTNSPVTLTWQAAKTSGKVDYEYEVARDAKFDFLEPGACGPTENTSVLNVALQTGVTYYFRVRVENTRANTLNGLWSDTRSFTIKTIGNVNGLGIGNADFVAPAQGATNVPLVPVLTWGVVANATYNIKLATDSAFTNVIDSKDGLTVAVYSPSKALEVNKTYFWEVQAVSGGIVSDWVGFAFTTTSPPPPPATTAPPATVAPPQTIIVPTPTFNVPAATVTVNPGPTQAPATPAYIWFIIVIGAVLVIAVIVLIVRTRRV